MGPFNSLAAAGDMPATLVSWVIHLLSRHPEVQNRLRSEVQQRLEDGKSPQRVGWTSLAQRCY